MGKLDLTNLKVRALFKMSSQTENILSTYRDALRAIDREEWAAVDDETREAFNQVTYALRRLVKVTNEKLEEQEQ